MDGSEPRSYHRELKFLSLGLDVQFSPVLSLHGLGHPGIGLQDLSDYSISVLTWTL